jgi:4-amino-4-deoxy-L-arabinose transferase-like glycosyltransferase
LGATPSQKEPLLSRKSLTSGSLVLLYLGIADFAAHMAFAGNYGYFRDELYYIVSGTQHLSLGYVDFPPMIAYIAALFYDLGKDSLISIHIVPALAEAILIFVAGLIAKELGGGRRAQIVAGMATLITLVFLATGSLFTPDALDQLWWSLLSYVTIRIVKRNEPKLWIIAGVIVGVGLLTKLSIFFFVVALFISLLAFSTTRKYLRSKWLVLGALITSILISPVIYWNAKNSWPMIQFYESFTGYSGGGGPIGFLLNQLLSINPLNIPILAAGLYFFLRTSSGRSYRSLGFSYIILYIFMTLINAKPYYLLPIYPTIFAAGALQIEKSFLARTGFFGRLGSTQYMACMIVSAIAFAPLLMPILPPANYVSSYGSLSGLGNSGAGQQNGGPMPQYLGDRFGWDTMVSTVAKSYDALSSQEKAEACIFTSNYGEASAINFLGGSYGLPKAISGHNNYYIWGPGSCNGQVVLTIGLSMSDNLKSYRNVTQVGMIECVYCMNSENNLPLYLCTNPIAPPSVIWPQLKHYD